MRTLTEVHIIGAGETKFGELWDRSLRELAVEAGLRAIEDAGIYSRDIGILYGSNTLAGSLNWQNDIGSLLADFSGIASAGIPAIRVESSTSSGASAIREAYLAIRSGEYDVAMVGGVEKMTDIYGSEILDVVSTTLDREWESFFGGTAAAMAAITARKYMHDFNVEKEALAAFSVNDHANASKNPNAHYRSKITLETAMKSTKVAEPLNIMDCSPVSDGGAALILASDKFAKSVGKEGVVIKSSAISQDYLALHSRDSLYTINSTVRAGRTAFEKAGIKKSDISFMELHNSYSIYGLLEIEDLGFAEKGKASDFVMDDISLTSPLPINPSGGLKAKGNPMGATGVGQAVEAYLQMKGKAKERQIKEPKYGLIHSMSGTGSTSVVHIIGGE